MSDKTSKWSQEHMESPTMKAMNNNQERQYSESEAKAIQQLRDDIAGLASVLDVLNNITEDQDVISATRSLGALIALKRRKLSQMGQ